MRGESRPLPTNWPALVKATRSRAKGKCEWKGCRRYGAHCDHIIPRSQGGTDDLGNLQWICEYHHNRKTAREANRSKQERQRPHVLPKAPVPGMIKQGVVRSGSPTKGQH